MPSFSYICSMKQAQLVDIHTHHPSEARTIRTVGTHPWHACDPLPAESEVATCEAVGEIGLDKRCGVDFALQKRLFEAQLDLAERYKKPVVLHCVKAFTEVMELLRSRTLAAVIFHGFIGSKEQAVEAVQRGYYLSFGVRTARSTKTIEALRATPLDRLFVETDEAEVSLIGLYDKIAALRGIASEELQEATLDNYRRLFARK